MGEKMRKIKLVPLCSVLSLTALLNVSQAKISNSKFKCKPSVDLKAFEQNSRAFMNQKPVKKNSKCEVVNHTLFNSEATKMNNKFVELKDRSRSELCQDVNGNQVCVRNLDQTAVIEGRAPIGQKDQVHNLVDNKNSVIDNLEEMESKGLTQSRLPIQPWSDDYWAIAKGVLGYRYADLMMQQVVKGKDEKTLYPSLRQYIEDNPVENYVLTGRIDELSPSEKYDLMIGDSEGRLTAKMWEDGQGYQDKYGMVEKWMGICHGWATAAYMLPRPVKSITVKSADGKHDITFRPSDLKSLGSLLWANGQARSKFIGGRCNDKNPKQDENGRLLSQKCFDNNPGSWHMAVVNQIGVSKRSMVMDATYDYEVWNHPITSYTYSYFNPVTLDHVETIEEGKVEMAAFYNDKFSKYRSNDAVAVVGVMMEVVYQIETRPSLSSVDNEFKDLSNRVMYYYDLEINAEGKIIGGEWYQNKHPDFLWTPPKHEKALSALDIAIRDQGVVVEKWDGKSSVPALYQKYSEYASTRGQPIAALIEKLFERASKD